MAAVLIIEQRVLIKACLALETDTPICGVPVAETQEPDKKLKQI